MASVKSLKIGFFLLSLSLAIDVFAAHQKHPKKVPDLGALRCKEQKKHSPDVDLGILRNQSSQSSEQKKQAVRRFKEACAGVGLCVIGGFVETAKALCGPIGCRWYYEEDDLNLLVGDEMQAEFDEMLPGLQAGPVNKILPIPKSITFDQNNGETQNLTKVDFRRDLCRILSLLKSMQVQSVTFPCGHTMLNHEPREVRLFSQEDKLLQHNVHTVVAQFTDDTELSLHYNAESQNWSCIHK